MSEQDSTTERWECFDPIYGWVAHDTLLDKTWSLTKEFSHPEELTNYLNGLEAELKTLRAEVAGLKQTLYDEMTDYAHLNTTTNHQRDLYQLAEQLATALGEDVAYRYKCRELFGGRVVRDDEYDWADYISEDEWLERAAPALQSWRDFKEAGRG